MRFTWLLLIIIIPIATIASPTKMKPVQYLTDGDYYYVDPYMDDLMELNADAQQKPSKYNFSAIPRAAIIPTTESSVTECEPEKPVVATTTTTTTECIPEKPVQQTAPPTTTTDCIPENEVATAGIVHAADESSASTTAAPGTAAQAATTPASEQASQSAAAGGSTTAATTSAVATSDQDVKSKELHMLVQQLYVAQARVQLEATEIKKAQAIANSAQQDLEEAANRVRTVTAMLQNAQQEVAAAAIRAQTAQLQLAAHDQLLFAARQDVDALSSQMVGLQAAEGISPPKINFDVPGLLEKLKQPLAEAEKPTPVPTIVNLPVAGKAKSPPMGDEYYYDIIND